MAFQLSPGVNVSEIDLTTVVPAVATSDGAIAGIFRWGPIGQRILIDSENALVNRFAKPTNFNAETWFTAANFLSYSNRLFVSRGANTSGATPSLSVNTVATTVTTNNVFRVPGDQRSLVSANMYVIYSQNTSVINYGRSVSVNAVSYDSGSNTTSITLNSNSSSNTQVALHFGNPGTSYSALAMETGAVTSNIVNQIVLNDEDYLNKENTFDDDVLYIAKYPGELGSSLRVGICDNADSFTSNINMGVANTTVGNTTGVFTISISNNTGIFVYTPGTGGTVANATTIAALAKNSISINDNIKVGNSSIGIQYMKVTAVGNVTTNASASTFDVNFEDPYRLHTSFVANSSLDTNVQRYWEFFNLVDSAPGQSAYVSDNGNPSANDELHVVVVDEDGGFTGTPGTILEVFQSLSRATDAKNLDGSDNYYKNIINQNSAYLWWGNDRSTAVSNTAAYVGSSTSSAPANINLILGNDGFDEANNSAFSSIAAAYDLFASTEDSDISLVMQGRPLGGSTSVNGVTVQNFQLANYIIDNICEVRKDCIALISPDKAEILNAFGNQATNLVAWRGAIRSTSYAVMDSGYKYQYDRYNDVNRWIPLNGDIAGLCVRTDNTNDAWWSPAGFNRGQIKNIIKLAYNPRKAERDILYPNGINPVVTFPGQGTVLYGDKTLQSKPSAFDRINVRRLFIVLEKAISRSAKFSLFEFNDAFTRSQFKNLVTPYLRNVQGRRGITDFLVVCDDTNNTPQIIDTNQFVGDIYIKPARSINFIQLNFVAVGTGVQFSEVVGRF
jgi:phage tail sheath protein FI